MKYLSERELRAAEQRNVIANRLRARIGIDKVSEHERMAAEIRAARVFRASRGLKTWPKAKPRQQKDEQMTPKLTKKEAALLRSIKKDLRAGRRLTLILIERTPDMTKYDGRFTQEELRLIRFEIAGAVLRPKTPRRARGPAA